MDIQKMELLAQVASLYYLENQTQDHIARQFGYSRSMVSRLLTEARQSGVVEIRVHRQILRNHSLEQQLIQAFSLQDARVLSRGTMDSSLMLRYLGTLAGEYLQTVIHSEMRIGVGWGSTLWETINSLQPKKYTGIDVVGIIGAVGTMNGEMDGPEIARRLARMFGGRYYILPAPLIVESEATQKAIMQDASLTSILDMAVNLDMALVGIGTTASDHSSIVRAGYIQPDEMNALHAKGIVGDICAIHFDGDGEISDDPINRRVVGISPDHLKKIPLRVAVAGGEPKAVPIYAACRTGLINVLITDEVAAQGALQRKHA
jgi:DNA-binding transcriptional regulator LsrR (DeoR family)